MWALLTGSCLLFSAILGSRATSSQKDLTLALFFFSLSSGFSPGRHSFILHAADHSSSSSSFLTCPHLPFFLTAACSSAVPLSSLCTAMECMWVLVGSPASTASQIPGLAALHPDCTPPVAVQRWGVEGAVLQGTTRMCYLAQLGSYYQDYRLMCVCSWKINMETVENCIYTLKLCMIDGLFCFFYEEWIRYWGNKC